MGAWIPSVNFKKTQNLLNYPGGKTHGAKRIMARFPLFRPGDKMASPFAGGAAIEIRMAQKGVRVHAYDINPELVNFWEAAIGDPFRLAQRYEELIYGVPVGKPQEEFTAHYKEMCAEYPHHDDAVERAARYLVINKCSYAGMSFVSPTQAMADGWHGISPARVRNFRAPNLSMEMLDYRESIPRHEDDFLYVDPPYYALRMPYPGMVPGGRQRDEFSESTMDHHALYELLRERKRWVLSYNDHPQIRDWYEPIAKVEKVSWKYTMDPQGKNQIKGKELLISCL